MTRPRSQIISLADTPFYHCESRCVRRAFLCGEDRYSGQTFDHRKPWLVDRLALLGEVFAIDLAAYAIMSNHYHVVLHADPARSRLWSRDDVIRRWLRLYKGDPLVLEIQKESFTIFNGLDKLAVRERGRTKKPRSPGQPHFRARMDGVAHAREKVSLTNDSKFAPNFFNQSSSIQG